MILCQVDPSVAAHAVDKGTDWISGQSPVVAVLAVFVLVGGYFVWRKLSPMFDKQTEAIDVMKEHAPQTTEALTSLARSARISNKRLQVIQETGADHSRHFAKVHETLAEILQRERAERNDRNDRNDRSDRKERNDRNDNTDTKAPQ